MPTSPVSSPAALLAWNVLALVSVGGLFAALYITVGRVRRGTPALNGILALAALVCTEAVILNVLSAAGLINRIGVLGAHGVLVGGAELALASTHRIVPPCRGWPRRVLVPHARWLLIAPLGVLAGASAFRYAPNSGDGMTYHLARVAHWIQNGSVAPYPSGSLRQNVLMPGAEYLLTTLQVIAGSDHLAVLVQLTSYGLVVAAAPALARFAGAPARWCWLAAPAVASTPMAVLQASSTQNDLLASAMVVAVVAASLPLFHRRPRLRFGPYLLLGIAVAGAGLVKSTALVAAGPFALLAGLGSLRARIPRGRAALAVALSALLTVGLVAPEAARRGTLPLTGLVVNLYGTSDAWGERLVNSYRGALHHIALPFTIGAHEPRVAPGQRPPRNMPSRSHEDFAGSPLQFAAVMGLLALLLFRPRSVPTRGRLAAVAWVAGWVVFHAVVKDNEYLSRLQLPWFVLSPILLAALPRGRLGGRLPAASHALAVAAALLFVTHGLWVAAHNEIRPPLVGDPGPREDHYYRNNPIVMAQQKTALKLARAAGCDRLGLYMGESGYDYPISRAAMAVRMSTRHVVANDDWPCAIYVEHLSWGYWNLPRASVALDAREWIAAATGPGGIFVFLRRAPGQGSAS